MGILNILKEKLLQMEEAASDELKSLDKLDKWEKNLQRKIYKWKLKWTNSNGGFIGKESRFTVRGSSEKPEENLQEPAASNKLKSVDELC